MAEVTLKAIENLLDKKLDEKFDARLKPVNDKLETLSTQVETVSVKQETLSTKVEAISTKLETVSTKLEAVSSKVETVSTKLEAVAETVSKHTDQLDGIAKDVKILLEAKTVNNYRLDRLEEWGVKVGDHLNIKLGF